MVAPIGCGINDDNEPHLDRTRHAAAVAKFFGAPFIRMFSYFVPEGDDPDGYRDEVIRRLRQLADGGDVRAGIALELAESPNTFLATVQIRHFRYYLCYRIQLL